MAEARFRKARDSFKILCKQDRQKYLPELIQANRRLAEQLMENGLISEAEQVLAYLKTIAPPSTIGVTDICFALKKQDWKTALDGALQLWKKGSEGQSERDRAAVADALVLAFPDLNKDAKMVFPESPDLAAILDALRSVSEEDWEKAQELLRSIPRGSLFADWKILIKGMIAFYSDDFKKTQTLFGRLSAHGVPVRAARAFELFLVSSEPPKFDEAARHELTKGACCLLEATQLAPALLRADQAWRAGRYVDSYKEIRGLPGFPSQEPDLAGALSDFYFKAPFSMRENAYVKFREWFAKLTDFGRFKDEREARAVYRMLGGLELEDPFRGDQLEDFWRKFLQLCPTDDLLSAKIESQVLEKVGAYYAEPAEADPFFFDAEDDALRDTDEAIRFLMESVKRDPSNLDAHLKLLKVYETTEQDSARNRLLARMTQSFPKDKAVLFLAGQESSKRQDYAQGAEYLERAHSLDPLDPEILNFLVDTYKQLARQQYEAREVKKGRETFDLARRHAVPDKVDFIRGPDFLQAFQGVLESVFGDHGMGKRSMTAALECTRSPVALLLYAHGSSRLCRGKKGSQFWTQLTQSRKQVTSASVRKDVCLTFEYLRAMDVELDWSAEFAFVADCLAPLGADDFTREEATFFLPRIWEYPEFRSLTKAIISKGLRHDPGDPRFRLFSVLSRSASPADLDIAKVDQIRLDAVRQGDIKTAQAAQAALSTAKKSLEFPIEDDDFGFTGDEISEMRSMAAQMSDAEFAKFREESRKYIPVRLFDEAMAGVRKKSSPKPKSEQRRPFGSKDQLELF